MTPEREGLRDLPFEEIPLISGLLRTADPVVIPSVAELGQEHASDRVHLEAQGIRSIYVVPQVVDGSTVGTVGVDYVRSEVAWGDERLGLLRSAAQAFAQAIERHRLLEERLGLLRRSVGSADDERRRLAEHVVRPLSEAIGLLRNTIADLTHPELTAVGLTDAIRQHADRILVPDGVEVTIEAALDAESTGEPEAFVTAFRIVQEALSNVRRHARDLGRRHDPVGGRSAPRDLRRPWDRDQRWIM